MRVKSILFNTEMVRAILDGRKTVTRRAIKLKYDNTHHEMKTDKYGTRLIEIQNDVEGETYGRNAEQTRGYGLSNLNAVKNRREYNDGKNCFTRKMYERA